MQSHMFSSYDYSDSTAFINTAKSLFRAEPSALDRLPDYALRSALADSRLGVSRAADDAAKELGLEKFEVEKAIDIAKYLLRALTVGGDAEDDAPEALAVDLAELTGSSAQGRQYQAVIGLLRALKERASPSFRIAMLRRAVSDSTLPRLESVTAQVDLRVVFDELYERGSDVACFHPRVIGIVPLAIIVLSLRGSDTRLVHLQLDRRQLEQLITDLTATMKQLQMAEQRIGVIEE